MSWALVQSAKATSGVTGSGVTNSVTAAFASNVTAGDRVFAFVDHYADVNPSAPTVSSSPALTWTNLVTNTGTSGTAEQWCSLYTAVVGSTGSLSVTVVGPASAGASFNQVGFTLQEYSGLDASAGSGCLDKSATAAGLVSSAPGANVSTGTTAATTAANQLALAYVGDDGSGETWVVVSGGFTKVAAASIDADPVTGMAVANKTSASGATEQCVFNSPGVSSDLACALVAVIKLAGAVTATYQGRPVVRGQSINRAANF